MANLKELAEQLVNLPIKEINELAAIMKEEYGIEPAMTAPVVVAGAGAQGVVSEPAAVEKTSYDVFLKSVGSSKLGVVKMVKELTGLGIKEAKELVDTAPTKLKEGLAKADAESMKSKLEEAGAEVELQ